MNYFLGTHCAAPFVGKNSLLWTAKKRANSRLKSWKVSKLTFLHLQVYRSYYDSPSATPYRVGAAASEDYVQEFIKEEFTARCNQVAGQIKIVLLSGLIV